MDYMGDQRYWDDKFGSRGDKPLRPEKVLVENLKYFKHGTVLDIACGDGRNALFLIEKGFEVKGIDFSTKALMRLERFAQRYSYHITTEQVDLSKEDALINIGVFDNILINHFRLKEELICEIKNHIREGGILFVSGFGHKHKIDLKIREEDLIQPEDFRSLEEDFHLVDYKECQEERGFFVTYIFKRK